MDEVKGALKSKINLTGLILVVLGAVTDPMFRSFFGDLIPPEWFGRVTFVAGWLVIYFRSNSAVNIPVDWKNPWKGAAGAAAPAILLCLCLAGLTACATSNAVKSGASPQETAQAACTDLATAFSLAQVGLTWTEIYFPNAADETGAAKELLDQAESARTAACAGVDLVADSKSLRDFLGRAGEIKALIDKVNAAIAKIKGKPAQAKSAAINPHPPVGCNGTTAIVCATWSMAR